MVLPPATSRDIPVYALYGEADVLHVPRTVHAEPISSRSLALDWRIAPHRHSSLFQALAVTEGRAVASAEGQRVVLAAPSLAWVPPLCVHAYEFAPGTAGIVVSIPAALLAGGLGSAPAVIGRLGRFLTLHASPGDRRWCEAERLAQALLAEHQLVAAGREAGLAALSTLLALLVARWAGGAHADEAKKREEPAEAAVRRFLRIVETSFAAPHPLPLYAREVGVSVSHLHRVCRVVTGRSPSRLLQDRRLLEAKRLLTYTAIPVGQVAFRLGFEDVAYFSRFFRSRTGTSPSHFRRAADIADGEIP